MNKKEVQIIIAANPKSCWRTIYAKLVLEFGRAGKRPTADIPGWALDILDKARPDCGYDCDGDVNGVGCPVSGRCEP